MAFRVGQRVRLTNQDDYSECGLKVGALLDVRRVCEGHVHIRNAKREDICIDNEDITKYPALHIGTILRETRKLPKHPIFELASSSPVFVMEGKVYVPTEETLQEANATFQDHGKVSPITEIATLSSLNELAYQRAKSQIDEIQNKGANLLLRGYGVGKNVTNRDITIQQFLYESVFPHLRKTKEPNQRLDKLLKLRTENNEITAKAMNAKALETAVKEIWGNLEEEIESGREILDGKRGNSFGYTKNPEISGDPYNLIKWRNNLALLNGTTYGLAQSDNPSELTVSIEGKQFILKRKEPQKVTEREYIHNLSTQINFNILEDNLSKEKLRGILKRSKDSAIIANLREYHEPGIGFFTAEGNFMYLVDSDRIEEGDIIAYIEIPSFGITNPYYKDEENQEYKDYRLFTGSKIGIAVKRIGNSFRCENEFYRIKEDETSWAMCNDGIRFRSYEDPGRTIAERLNRMKKTILQGSSEDWYGLSQEYDPATLDQLRRMKVKIRRGIKT